tara:strand:- start:359 stop:910 length:552 start_codon:yes stop_codon:yes gene_type:complete
MEDILSLRRRGMSFRDISKKLGCSKATISYHCGKTQSEKKRVKAQHHDPLSKKVNRFKSRCTKEAWRTFRTKIKGFKKRSKGVGKARTDWRVHNVSTPYTCKDVVVKIGDNPICYLTGRKINLNRPSTYSLDHIIPIAKGGSNDLNNLGITCLEVNHAKGSLSLGKFYSLCEEVLAWRDKQSG